MQGSIIFKSDPNGNILHPDTYGQSYLPYGSELKPGIYKDTLTGEIGEHIGFINKPYNSATGLSYFGARYYDPLIGRFMGTDPVGYMGGTTSFNRYAYSNDNPARYKDPSGCFGWDTIGEFGVGAVGGAASYGIETPASKQTLSGYTKSALFGGIGAAVVGVANPTASPEVGYAAGKLYGDVTWGTAINVTIAGIRGDAANALATTAGALNSNVGEMTMGQILGQSPLAKAIANTWGNLVGDYSANKIKSFGWGESSDDSTNASSQTPASSNVSSGPMCSVSSMPSTSSFAFSTMKSGVSPSGTSSFSAQASSKENTQSQSSKSTSAGGKGRGGKSGADIDNKNSASS